MPRRRSQEEQDKQDLFDEMMDDYITRRTADKESFWGKLFSFLNPASWKPGDPERRKAAPKPKSSWPL